MSKRKTASIVTMHFPCNFGAVLQVYGLSRYLQNSGLNVNIINYIPRYFAEKNSLWYIGNAKYRNNPFLKILYFMYMVPQRLRRNHVFAVFRHNELNLTEQFTQDELMKGDKINSDFYFCGSDQIWNEINETLFDPIYFLQFVKDPIKRFSYAASGTISYPFSKEVESIVVPWIKSFNKVAVREEILKQNLQSTIKTEVNHVCDPVFLLSKREWLSLTEKANVTPIKHSYIIVYAIGDDCTPYKKARELGDKLSLPVYAISWFKCPYVNRTLRCTPYEFLRYIADAKYVITNSFHGTAFSIIFNRIFWVCNTSIANHRLLSILEKVHLRNRLLEKHNQICMDDEIDWNCVQISVCNFIDSSKEYLKRCTGI